VFTKKCINSSFPSGRYFVVTLRKMVRCTYTKIGEEVKTTCKTTFLHSLDIKPSWVDTAMAKVDNKNCVSPDKRGKHQNRPDRVADAKIPNVVCLQINLFPKTRSLFNGERTRREHLESGVTIEACLGATQLSTKYCALKFFRTSVTLNR